MKSIPYLSFYISLALLSSNCSNNANTAIEKEDNGAWKIVNLVDDFGDVKEGESAIVATFPGKMSNSAVSDESLIVKFEIYDSTTVVGFYEYGREPKAQLPDRAFINLKLKLSNGEVLGIKQFLFKDYMVDSDNELLALLLSQENPIKAILDFRSIDRYESTVYEFTIEPKGLKALKEKMKK